MRIVARPRLRQFATQHASQAAALRGWETIVHHAQWRSWPDVRKTYRTADRVVLPKGNEITIFNVGDGFRLLVFIKYVPATSGNAAPPESIVYIKEFLTHAEYDAGGWKDRLDHE